MRLSKNKSYEKPYSVTGIIQLAGLKQAPKYKCTDRYIGTWKGIRLINSIDCRRTISNRTGAEK